MITKVYSAIPCGYNGKIIEVEASLVKGLPVFNLVGMADKTIFESRDRVRNAIQNSDLTFPPQKVTVNLAPANLIKTGSTLDLPIAIAILAGSKQLTSLDIMHKFFVGELSLSGDLRPVYGIINIVEAARDAGFTEIYLPSGNLNSAAIVDGIKLFPIKNLRQLFLHLKGQTPIAPISSQHYQPPRPSSITNFDTTLDQVYGLNFAKRALTLALAGHHNILFCGPPGSGKTLLAKTIPALLPQPNTHELLEITKLTELSKALNTIYSRPFRSPHHSSSACAVIGGGNPITPGEISLAHHGVLFLDELPEFSRQIIEALRQPLEDHQITIARTKEKVTYPANFILVATMNPCPCGFYGSKIKPCTCTPNEIQRYQKKISGPILDRIDIKVNVPYLGNQKILNQFNLVNPSSIQEQPLTHHFIKNSIQEALDYQKSRYQTDQLYNGILSSSQITKFIHLNDPEKRHLEQASNKLQLSARSLLKIIRLSRTIADLDHSNNIKIQHLSEAISFNQP